MSADLVARLRALVETWQDEARMSRAHTDNEVAVLRADLAETFARELSAALLCCTRQQRASMTERISDERLEGLRQFARVYIGVNLSMISLPCRDVDAVIEELQQARARIAALTAERDAQFARAEKNGVDWEKQMYRTQEVAAQLSEASDDLSALEKVYERAWAAARGATAEYREGKFDLDHAVADLRRRAEQAEAQLAEARKALARDDGPDERLMAHLRRRTLEATKDREAVDELDWYLSKGDTKRLARVTQAVQEYLREAWGLPND